MRITDSAWLGQADRGCGHHIKILTEEGRSIFLDLPGQEEIWQRVNVGDPVVKPFGKDTLVPAIQASGDQ
jgi:hypothetical protein